MGGCLVICSLVFTVYFIAFTVFFVLFVLLCIFIPICFVYTSVRTTATE